MAAGILIIEDDNTTAEFLAEELAASGYSSHWAATGPKGLDTVTSAPPGTYALVILDGMIPGLPGLDVLRCLRVRGVTTPVLFLSALATVEDRVAGLRAGADDYLVKPFAFQELLARIERLIDRPIETPAIETELVVGEIRLDLLTRRAKRNEREIDLHQREFQLLEFLMRNSNHIVTRAMLLESVWNYHFDPGTNVVEVHISHLRKKIEAPRESRYLETIRGVGYRFAPAQAA